jgi:hypothetical protein
MKKEQARGVVRTLFGFFPNVRHGDEIIEAWAEQLEAEDVGDATTAAHQLARDSNWRPSLAAFLQATWNVKRDRVRIVKHQSTVEYPHHIGVRSPCDDELSDTRWAEAVRVRGSMVGK